MFFVVSLTPLIVSHMHMLVLPNLLFSTSILSYCCSEGVCCVSNLQSFSRQHYGKSQIVYRKREAGWGGQEGVS